MSERNTVLFYTYAKCQSIWFQNFRAIYFLFINIIISFVAENMSSVSASFINGIHFIRFYYFLEVRRCVKAKESSSVFLGVLRIFHNA